MRKTIFVIFVILLLLRNAITFADIPHLINYQGRLTDSQGTPITGTKAVTFRIYDTESGGSALWSETYSNLAFDKGIFNVMLGGVTALNLAFDKPYWLSIQVGGDPEMTPRIRLASVGYAYRAENADNVTGVIPIVNGGTGQSNANAALNALLPSQSGNSGKFLTSDGTNAGWANTSEAGLKIGYFGSYANNNYNPAGYVNATKVKCVKSCTVTALSITIGSATNPNGYRVRLGIYNDSSNAPSNLLAQTGEIICTANDYDSAIYGAIPATNLTAGNVYWLAVINDNQIDFLTSGSHSNQKASVQRYVGYGSLPDPFGSPTGAGYNFGIQGY